MSVATGHSRTTAMSPLVHEELQWDRQFHPNLGGVTRGGMANHFPMTVLALHGLGASDNEVRAFGASWPRHRATIEGDLQLVDRGHVTAENWAEFLGQSERLLEFRRVFEALLGGGRELEVVAGALAVMRDSLPMGLFHPLIRVSFAVTHGDRGLIADALAYMAIRHLDLFRANALTEAVEGTGSAASVWRRVAGDERVLQARNSIDGGSIRVCERLCAERSLHAAALPADLALRVSEVCLLALRLYVFAPSLTTLHAVTAAQALADLTARCGSAQTASFSALWARYWIWLTALYVEKGRPAALPAAERTPSHDWDALAARARATPEVHLIKMAYSCRWLDETFGPEPLYALAVANMLAEETAHPRRGAGFSPTRL